MDTFMVYFKMGSLHINPKYDEYLTFFLAEYVLVLVFQLTCYRIKLGPAILYVYSNFYKVDSLDSQSGRRTFALAAFIYLVHSGSPLVL